MRELSRIRRVGTELVFETKLRRKRGQRGLRWGVIVAERAKLRFDQCSLFFERDGRYLRNRTSLGRGGQELKPPIRRTAQPHGSQNFRPPAPAIPAKRRRFCDIPYIKEDYFVIQPNSYGAERGVGRCRSHEPPENADRLRKMRRKAFSLLAPLEGLHYDNCKVVFSRRTAFRYALGALIDGHDERRIEDAYERALFVCHGFAVDRAAHTGTILHFNASSTVKKARERLVADGLTAEKRRKHWYAHRSVTTFDPAEMEAIRVQIAATFRPSDG